MKIELRYDDAAAREALRKAPDVLTKVLGFAIQRGAEDFARAARANVAKHDVTGKLRNSTIARKVSALHWEVHPSSAYAAIFELGSGPAAGRPKYYPNPDNLKDFLMNAPSYRGHGWAAPGSTKRGNQELDIWLRSRAWAWGIYQKGTKAFPFMAPAYQSEKGKVVERANEAMRRAIAEINGGSYAAG